MTALQMGRLLAVIDSLAEALTPAQVAEVVVEQGVAALGARAGSIALLTDGGTELELVCTVGYPQEMVEAYRRFRVSAGLPIAEAVRTGEPIFLETWEQWSARYPSAGPVRRPAQDRAWAALPLMAKGRVIGGIGLSFSRSYAFPPGDKVCMLRLSRQCAQAMDRARLYEETEKARIAAQAAEARMAFLAAATTALSASLDYQGTLAELAQLAVPDLADWCAVDILTGEGTLERLAIAHVNPAKAQWGRELQSRYPADPNATTGIYQALRTGQPAFYPDISDEMLVAAGRNGEHLAMLRHIGFRSAIIMPLVARGRTLGAISLITTRESGRTYGNADLAFAADLAGRAAIAVDNARLYRERQVSEQQTGETLAQLEAVLAGSPVGFGFMDREFRFVRVNDTLAQVNGLSAREHVGRFIWDVIGEQQWHYRRRFFERALAGEAVLDVDISETLPRYSPAQRYLLASYFPVRQGEEVIGIGAIINDVTERRAAEEKIRESEQRFRLLADTAPVMIWMAGADSVRNYFNKPWLNFTGSTPAQERAGGWLRSVHPDDYDRCRSISHRAFQACEPFEMEYRLRRADGQYRWIIDIGSPRFTPDGSFIGYIGSGLDMTDRKRAEQALLENETRQRSFLRDILASVTEGKLRLCDRPDDLPPRLTSTSGPIPLSTKMLNPVRHAAREAARAQGFEEDRTQDLVTAVGEAAMNAAVHAGGGVGSVCSEAGAVQVWIEDQGTGIDVNRLPRATLERGFTTAGTLGHGFWIMLRTADIMWLRTGSTGTTVVIEQHKDEPEPSWLQEGGPAAVSPDWRGTAPGSTNL